MESSEPHLFQKPIPSAGNDEVIISKRDDTLDDKPLIGDIDHHMMEIVGAYVKKLPDNKSRKHIARLMINIIIKSADL